MVPLRARAVFTFTRLWIHIRMSKSWGRWDCAASMHRSAGAVRADTELIPGMPGTKDRQDPLCSVSCVYVPDLDMRTVSA